jgi:hypothetical protein
MIGNFAVTHLLTHFGISTTPPPVGASVPAWACVWRGHLCLLCLKSSDLRNFFFLHFDLSSSGTIPPT